MKNVVWMKGTSGLDGEFQSASEVDFYIDKVGTHFLVYRGNMWLGIKQDLWSSWAIRAIISIIMTTWPAVNCVGLSVSWPQLIMYNLEEMA